MEGQTTTPGWIPQTDAEKSAVLNQLDRLLADPSFARSQRYPSCLRFVVSRALAGESDLLKERILGIEIFGRKPDYDTTEDPIVRVTATKIRKRILAYYAQPEHYSELKLSFPAGSYVPIFESPREGCQPEPAAKHLLPVSMNGIEARQSLKRAEPPDPFPVITVPTRPSWQIIGAALFCLLMIAAVSVLVWRGERKSAFVAFWGSLLNSHQNILLCIGDEPRGTVALMDASNPVLPSVAGNPPSIVDVDNVGPVSAIVQMLSTHGQESTVQGQRRTTLSNLSGGPTILLGAYNNVWTLRFTQNMRFHFADEMESKTYWIEDRNNPGNRAWMRDIRMQVTETGTDYALVARFRAPDTGQPTVVIAGISHYSNLAAVNFLLSAEALRQLDAIASPRWRDANLEFVLKMTKVDGHTGTPAIVAADVW